MTTYIVTVLYHGELHSTYAFSSFDEFIASKAFEKAKKEFITLVRGFACRYDMDEDLAVEEALKNEFWSVEHISVYLREADLCTFDPEVADSFYSPKSSIPAPIMKAFLHVRAHHSEVKYLFFDREGCWAYMDEELNRPSFGEEIDISVLEKAADSVSSFPVMYEFPT